MRVHDLKQLVGFPDPSKMSPAELCNNYIQQRLDNFTQKRGHPTGTEIFEILRRRAKQIVRKTHVSSCSKSQMESMSECLKEMYNDNGNTKKI